MDDQDIEDILEIPMAFNMYWDPTSKVVIYMYVKFHLGMYTCINTYLFISMYIYIYVYEDILKIPNIY
jgi:hypothetical protein